jgi:hypothetical protein
MKVNPDTWPEQRGDTRSHRGERAQNISYVKFRVTVNRRMHKDEVMRLLGSALRTGIVPKGISIAYIDWESGREGKYNDGRIPKSRLTEMRAFYGAYEARTGEAITRTGRVKAGH